jgi:hypothetical protein
MEPTARCAFPQGCVAMMSSKIATALTLAFLAYFLSVLPITTAKAQQCVTRFNQGCLEGEIIERTGKIGGPGNYTLYQVCCPAPKLPSEPYATGETDAERQNRFAKECAELGKAWYPQWQKCLGPDDQAPVVEGTTSGNSGGFIQMRPTCAEGFRWSERQKNCVRN